MVVKIKKEKTKMINSNLKKKLVKPLIRVVTKKKVYLKKKYNKTNLPVL